MTLVLKIGGAAGIGGEALADDLARVVASGRELVIVHGGSDAATRLQGQLGRPASFLVSPSGHTSRRTDRKDLEAFAMATALVNRRLVEDLGRRGVRAFGLTGLDGGLVRGPRKASVRAVVDGRTRIVRDQWTGRPEQVDTQLLRTLLDAGLVPVLGPLVAGPAGEMLNVDGDRLAALVAARMGAEELVILTNVAGLLEDPQDERTLIRSVGASQLDAVEGFAQGRMRKKLLGAREALAGGVPRVVLADARRARPLADALEGMGTVIDARFDAGREEAVETLEGVA